MSEHVRTVALAICKSRTCEGASCCQWPANRGRVNCNAMAGAYDEAAEAAIAAMPGWQPIETAPKDGTRILAWPVYSDDLPAEARWRYMRRTPGRWETGSGPIYGNGPTHWMPLPPSPEAQP